MKWYRVCVDGDGNPVSVFTLPGIETRETYWLYNPDRTRHPETPEEATHVHYLHTEDELGAYLKAQEIAKNPKRTS